MLHTNKTVVRPRRGREWKPLTPAWLGLADAPVLGTVTTSLVWYTGNDLARSAHPAQTVVHQKKLSCTSLGSAVRLHVPTMLTSVMIGPWLTAALSVRFGFNGRAAAVGIPVQVDCTAASTCSQCTTLGKQCGWYSCSGAV